MVFPATNSKGFCTLLHFVYSQDHILKCFARALPHSAKAQKARQLLIVINYTFTVTFHSLTQNPSCHGDTSVISQTVYD